MPYHVYLTTNPRKSVLYTGITNDLQRRIDEHYQNRGLPKTFAGRYYCYLLIYFETFAEPQPAIDREKQIKGWTRAKKEALIASINPNWDILSPPLAE